jgi:dipeptidyl aminopeptidase/acylaminoacyl peptidase
VNIEDVLATEFAGRAEFSPDGHWLVYNRVPPYASLSDFSYWMHAGGMSGHQVWVKDLTNQTAPFEQPGLDPAATNFLFGVSADSAWLVALEYRMGRLRLAACRFGEEACVRFDPMPDIRDRYAAALQWNERLNWISNDRIVMPVRRSDLPGSEMRNRAATGAFLSDAWRRAWTGDGVTASVVTSTGWDRSADWAEGDLAVFNLSTGKTEVLARGRYAGVTVSPDQRFVLAARVAERVRPAADARPIARETHPIFDRRYALRLIDVRTGTINAFETPFQVDPGSLTWRADSAAFSVFGWSKDETIEQGRFYAFRLNDKVPAPMGPATFLPSERVSAAKGRWWTGPAAFAFVGDGLIAHGRLVPTAPARWYYLGPHGEARSLSETVAMADADLVAQSPGSVLVASEGAIYRLGPERDAQRIELGAPVRVFTYRPYAEHGASPESYPMPGFSPRSITADALLIDTTGSDEDAAIRFVSLESSPDDVVRIDVPVKGARVIAASRSAAALFASVKSGAATQFFLVRKGHPPEALFSINEHLNRVQPPKTRQIQYSLESSARPLTTRTVSACLLLPPNFDPARRYPVLMEIYPAGRGGGCETLADTPSAGPMAADLWAARGFIYVRPAFPLDLMKTPADPLGGLGELVDQTIDALGTDGFVDTGRVVAYGFSQGGIASLVAGVQSRRLRAVISINGWADYVSHYFGARGLMRYFHLDQNGGDNRWRYECEGEGAVNSCPFGFGTSAFSDPARFLFASPVTRAESISAPVLLVHSDFDYFDMSQYDEMFGALYRAGKEATYVRYWGEGHGPSSPANIRDLWQQIDTFLSAQSILPDPADQPTREEFARPSSDAP